MSKQRDIDATDRSLGLLTVWHVLLKLEWELAVLARLDQEAPSLVGPLSDPMKFPLGVLYAGINAASTAWSVTDWVWRDLEEDDDLKRVAAAVLGTFITKNEFQILLRKVHELDVCHQICQAAKHRKMHAPAMTIGFSTEAWMDVYTNEQDVLTIRWSSLANLNHSRGASATTMYSAARVAHSWWHHFLGQIGMREIHVVSGSAPGVGQGAG